MNSTAGVHAGGGENGENANSFRKIPSCFVRCVHCVHFNLDVYRIVSTSG